MIQFFLWLLSFFMQPYTTKTNQQFEQYTQGLLNLVESSSAEGLLNLAETSTPEALLNLDETSSPAPC